MSPATDTFDAWTERVTADRSGTSLKEADTVTVPGEQPFMPINMARAERAHYIGEVGKKGNDYLFHFYPVKRLDAAEFNKFEQALGDAFLEVFKFEERVQASYVEEMSSWSVRATGFASNPLADDLIVRVFDLLDKKLE